MKKEHPYIQYEHKQYTEEEILERSKSYYEFVNSRRSIRDFSPRPVPQEIIENIILAAGTAPSGAHKQPWSYCLISSAEIKSKIRTLAEEEEKRSYGGRMSEQWIQDLEPLGTTWEKPFLDTVPWIIAVFRKIYDVDEDGKKRLNYYVNESIGISVGFLLAAIHHAGLVALTHTPSPMNFLTQILDRPENEKPYLLIPVGFPEENATIPDIARKPLSGILSHY